MARLIVKSPYLKGGGKGGYLKYIGTREGVEKFEQQPSGYMEYMAARPRSHGLFGDKDEIDLDTAMREVNEYPGNIWTHIISLKREDAERLGYDHAAQWRNLLRAHRNKIAQAMHIPPQDFRWYAAFHDEGDHPHVHMMAWSVKPGQAYLSREGIQKIKSVLTNDIFKQEMLHTYEQKSASRDDLVREAKKAMRELTRQMRSGVCSNPEIETLMVTLVTQLETVQGKKKYGYLPKKVKATVDETVNQMARLPVVDKCYQVWWELQCQIEDYYSERQRERPHLSERKEFRSIKNAVIQEAENIRMGTVTFEDDRLDKEREDEQDDRDAEQAAIPRNLWGLVMDYQEAKAVLYDDDARWEEKEEAIQTLEALWDNGLTVAAHQLGKCYRDGLGVIPDDEKAEEWFRKSAEAGNGFSQYALGKLLQQERRIKEAVEWYEKASAQRNQYADYRLGKRYLQGKDVTKDVSQAVDYLTRSAESGNQYAQYALGKLYLMGQEVSPDRETAWYWFTQSADQGNQYAQFFLDHFQQIGRPSVFLAATKLLHHLAQTFRQETVPPEAPVGLEPVDRKLRAQIRERKIAMGHKPDDHEEQQQMGWGGMSM